MAIWLLSRCGPDILPLFACLYVAMGCITALLTLAVGPMCAETVPAMLGATASGIVIATGELFGGGIAPVVAGWSAQRFGIEHILWTPMAALTAALLIGIFYKESEIKHG